MEKYFRTENLAVGYSGKILIDGINIEIGKGTVLSIIGPNGSGKSTILKSITKQLPRISGKVFIDGTETGKWSQREFAEKVSVVLTDRVRPELLSCAEIVAMGRYPYTDMLGRMTAYDKKVTAEALEMVNASDLADRDFMTLSDGQRQRIMLARAICQEPDIIVLDEPTAYLDIRYKVEILSILRRMAAEKNTTVIMSIHEIDLATKVSDCLVCVKDNRIAAYGKPEELMKDDRINKLYNLNTGSYNLLFGSTELSKAEGTPEVFVIAGGGCGIPVYRELQKKNIPFATGILYENDIDFQVAAVLSDHVISSPAFEPVTEECIKKAEELMIKCGRVIDAGTPHGTFSEYAVRLLEAAEKAGIRKDCSAGKE